ncbi:MAG: sensor histidine kinase [Geminicoccaceae bacterium]
MDSVSDHDNRIRDLEAEMRALRDEIKMRDDVIAEALAQRDLAPLQKMADRLNPEIGQVEGLHREAQLTQLAAQLAATTRRFEIALERSAVVVFEQDRDLRYRYAYNLPQGFEKTSVLGKSDQELMNAADRQKIIPVKERVLDSGVREQIEVTILVGNTERTYDLIVEPKWTNGGEIDGVICAAIDVTAQREREEHHQLVMRELTHRSKNLLAVIQAMARQTATRSRSLETFVPAFAARLRAIAASHDLLISQSWRGAGLRELILTQLGLVVAPSSPQVRLSGPGLQVNADTAQNLGLAFHELTTNAAKYGALSVKDGIVHVSWSHEQAVVCVIWRERGGPPVEQPKHEGFGRVLLQRSVGATIDGSVDTAFERQGVVCRMSFPTERLI